MPAPSWTARQIEILIRMAKAEHSSAEIGEVLGKSRNAIIGKCHRLGIPLGKNQDKYPSVKRRVIPRTVKVKIITAKTCAEVIGEPRNAKFCNQPATHGSYCAWHGGINYKSTE